MKNIEHYNFDERAAIEAGLRALITYNKAMAFSVDEKFIDSDIIEQYFKAEDENKAADLEKIIGASAVKACYDNPDILRKKHNSQLMASQFLDACRAAKIEYEYNTGKYGVGLKAEAEYKKRQEEHRIVTTATYIEKAKHDIKRLPARILKSGVKRAIVPVVVGHIAASGALGTAIAGASVTIASVTISAPLVIGAVVGTAITLAAEAVWRFTPPAVKKKIKDTIHTVAQKAEAAIERAVEKFENTTIGKKVKYVMEEKVAPFINRGAEIVEHAYETVKSTVKSGWTRLISLFT